MIHVVKGDAMQSGARSTAQAVPANGRFAVGLFGGHAYGSAFAETRGLVRGSAKFRPGLRPALPPRTLVLVCATGR